MPIPELSYLFETAPSVQIIRMRNAHWVIPFLFKAFKSENILSLSEPALIGALAEELRHHAEDDKCGGEKHAQNLIKRANGVFVHGKRLIWLQRMWRHMKKYSFYPQPGNFLSPAGYGGERRIV